MLPIITDITVLSYIAFFIILLNFISGQLCEYFVQILQTEAFIYSEVLTMTGCLLQGAPEISLRQSLCLV